MGDIDLESLRLPAVRDNDRAGSEIGSTQRRSSPTASSLNSSRRRSRGRSPITANAPLENGSAHSRPSPGPQSLHSSRRSPSPVSIRPQEPVGNGSRRSRTSPAQHSLHSSRRRSSTPTSIRPNGPVANGSARSRTSPNRQSPHSSRRRSPSAGSARPNRPTSGAARSVDSSELDYEEVGIFDFAEELRREKPPGEPWFMEMTRLRRMHFLWLNKELAAIRKKILQDRRASKKDMRTLQGLLRDQGRISYHKRGSKYHMNAL